MIDSVAVHVVVDDHLGRILLSIVLENKAQADAHFGFYGFLQRRVGDSWIDVVQVPFGGRNQPGTGCKVEVTCPITPLDAIIRGGARLEFFGTSPAVAPGEFRFSVVGLSTASEVFVLP